MFEGAGLGARIATLRYLPEHVWRKWTMAVVFAFTTSAGMTLVGRKFYPSLLSEDSGSLRQTNFALDREFSSAHPSTSKTAVL